MKKYVFVGFDPGSTIGLALVDINGKPIKIYSKKSAKFSEIIEEIISVGSPILISIDKEKPSHLAKKIASLFRTKLLLQEKEPIQLEKQKMVKEILGWNCSNDHERDAAYSAFYAFKKYENLIERIKKITENEEEAGFVLKMVLNNMAANIKDAIKLLHEKPYEEKEEKESDKRGYRSYEKTRRLVSSLMNEVEFLRKLIEAKNKKIQKLEETIRKIQQKPKKEVKVKILSNEKRSKKLEIIETHIAELTKKIIDILSRKKVAAILIRKNEETILRLLNDFVVFDNIILVTDIKTDVGAMLVINEKEASKYFDFSRSRIIEIDEENARKIKKELLRERVNKWLEEYRRKK